jgi:hypothetical protein
MFEGERMVLFLHLLNFVVLLLASLLFTVFKETLSGALSEYKGNFWFTLASLFLILMQNSVVVRLIG